MAAILNIFLRILYVKFAKMQNYTKYNRVTPQIDGIVEGNLYVIFAKKISLLIWHDILFVFFVCVSKYMHLYAYMHI